VVVGRGGGGRGTNPCPELASMSTSSSDVEDDGLQTSSNSGGGNSDEYYGDDAGISGGGGGGGGGSSGTFKDRFNKFAVSAKKASVKAGSKIAEKSKEVGSIVAEKSSKLGSQMAEKSSDLVDKAKQMKKPQIPNLLSRTGSKSGCTFFLVCFGCLAGGPPRT